MAPARGIGKSEGAGRPDRKPGERRGVSPPKFWGGVAEVRGEECFWFCPFPSVYGYDTSEGDRRGVDRFLYFAPLGEGS